MKVYLLLRAGSKRPLFYSEDPEILQEEEALRGERPPRGWLERASRRLRARLIKASRRAGPRLKKLRHWLGTRLDPDETLLRGLRMSEAVEVFHPSTFSAREARRHWMHYLAQRRRHHAWRALRDALICPLTLPLMFLPGPNVIGFWFVYRAIMHVLAVRGISRARNGTMPTSYTPCPALDEPLSPDEDNVAGVESACGLRGLNRYLHQLDKRQLEPIAEGALLEEPLSKVPPGPP